MKLKDAVNVIENNENCVILEVKEDCFDTICRVLGFTGDERTITYLKGADHTIIIKDASDKSCRWNFGRSGYTLISSDLKTKQKSIIECIEVDFDIYCGDNQFEIKKSIENFNKTDIIHKIKFMDGGINGSICVHKNDSYYNHFKNIELARQHFIDLGFSFIGDEIHTICDQTKVNIYTVQIKKTKESMENKKSSEDKFLYYVNEIHSAGEDVCQYGLYTTFEKALDKLKKLTKKAIQEKSERINYNIEDPSYGDETFDFEEGVVLINEFEDYTNFKIEKLPIIE